MPPWGKEFTTTKYDSTYPNAGYTLILSQLKPLFI